MIQDVYAIYRRIKDKLALTHVADLELKIAEMQAMVRTLKHLSQ